MSNDEMHMQNRGGGSGVSILVLFLGSSNILQRNRIKIILEKTHWAKNDREVLGKQNFLLMFCNFWLPETKSKAFFL